MYINMNNSVSNTDIAVETAEMIMRHRTLDGQEKVVALVKHSRILRMFCQGRYEPLTIDLPTTTTILFSAMIMSQ